MVTNYSYFYLQELICPLIYISNSPMQAERCSQHFQLEMTNTKGTTNTKEKYNKRCHWMLEGLMARKWHGSGTSEDQQPHPSNKWEQGYPKATMISKSIKNRKWMDQSTMEGDHMLDKLHT